MVPSASFTPFPLKRTRASGVLLSPPAQVRLALGGPQESLNSQPEPSTQRAAFLFLCQQLCSRGELGHGKHQLTLDRGKKLKSPFFCPVRSI